MILASSISTSTTDFSSSVSTITTEKCSTVVGCSVTGTTATTTSAMASTTFFFPNIVFGLIRPLDLPILHKINTFSIYERRVGYVYCGDNRVQRKFIPDVSLAILHFYDFVGSISGSNLGAYSLCFTRNRSAKYRRNLPHDPERPADGPGRGYLRILHARRVRRPELMLQWDIQPTEVVYYPEWLLHYLSGIPLYGR
ncbi:hypothetical protein M406DRAFT_327765 [Cryphonectria parasitica EP155]|uniref:Uncharacterized protein n=1 Tax=Cryphonectria parasitica (strain ATCC 38755 / EP155) TaxID=660469 RepID=A0A9P4Y5S8_CRYP1|nr:uncharacterized protein M406DRAFT_327765 [Cryphonectria parasitica EP155]KAF3766635.1 hypothetical protein M406DRAFT_327765 [Cryphonectria parasitica EP155]